MNFTVEFLVSQFLNWIIYALDLVPGGFPLPLGDLSGFLDWYTYAYLYIGENFPLGDLAFWIIQLWG